MTALALGILALVLVGPGPLWVARWGFLYRVPRAAVVLWQAGSLAALISVFGAALVVLVPFSEHWSAIAALPGWQIVGYGLLEAFALVVIARLVWSLISVARATRVRRNRHRAAVDLLGVAEPGMGLPGLRVLAAELPLAYCLPGVRGSRVVLSAGTLAALQRDELEAVIEHESAHIRARHDIVVDTFVAVHRAFPYAVRTEIPVQQCRLLVEMLADDAARRRVGALPLSRALVTLAAAPTPVGELGANGSETARRIERLTHPAGPRILVAGVYGLAVGLNLLPVLIMVIGPVSSI
jgi:hypothetical protein